MEICRTGLTAPSGQCSGGFYCTGSSSSPTPTPTSDVGGICPKGSYCESASATPKACAPGTYANETGRESCDPCPARYSCASETITPAICQAGAYCPPETNSTLPLCIPGTFSNMMGLSSVDECALCTPGKYCATFGLTAVSGNVQAGYYCPGSCIDQFGRSANTSDCSFDFRICPSVHYCPTSSAQPTPCPIGTYRSLTGATAISDCLDCTPGSFCNATGLSQPSGLCKPGHYCKLGAINAAPVGNPTGDICSRGHFCVQGSVQPVACAAGSYNDVYGAEQCKICPDRYFCPANSTGYIENECPEVFSCF